jgi:hypothetical protein
VRDDKARSRKREYGCASSVNALRLPVSASTTNWRFIKMMVEGPPTCMHGLACVKLYTPCLAPTTNSHEKDLSQPGVAASTERARGTACTVETPRQDRNSSPPGGSIELADHEPSHSQRTKTADQSLQSVPALGLEQKMDVAKPHRVEDDEASQSHQKSSSSHNHHSPQDTGRDADAPNKPAGGNHDPKSTRHKALELSARNQSVQSQIDAPNKPKIGSPSQVQSKSPSSSGMTALGSGGSHQHACTSPAPSAGHDRDRPSPATTVKRIRCVDLTEDDRDSTLSKSNKRPDLSQKAAHAGQTARHSGKIVDLKKKGAKIACLKGLKVRRADDHFSSRR